MKEVQKTLNFSASLIDNSTGEVHNVDVNHKITEKYYSIKRLNIKVHYMDLIETQSKLCNSSKDILLFGTMFQRLDKGNRLNINVSKFSRDTGYSRTKVTMMLKKGVDCGFLLKEKTGVYFVNPFIIRGTAFKSNESFEAIQFEWESCNGK